MCLKKVFKQQTKRQDSLRNITGSYVKSNHAILSISSYLFFFFFGGGGGRRRGVRLRRTEDEIEVFGQKIKVIKRVCYELSRVDPMNVFPPYCAASVNKAADLSGQNF